LLVATTSEILELDDARGASEMREIADEVLEEEESND